MSEQEIITEEAPAPEFDGVVVIREQGADGGYSTRVILSGDVRATEVETVLKLGLRGWQQHIGV